MKLPVTRADHLSLNVSQSLSTAAGVRYESRSAEKPIG